MTFELARAIARRHDVDEQISISDRCEMRNAIVGVGVRVDEARLPSSPRRLPIEFPRLIAAWIGLLRTIGRDAPNVVMVVMGSPWSDVISRALGWMVRRRGGRLVRFVHDAVAHPGDSNRSPAWIEREAMRAADCYVVLSEHVESQLRSQGVPDEQIVRSEHGPFSLGAPRVDVGASHRPFRLLFFGRLAEYKGLDLLVEAARAVADRDVLIDVRIVGDGPLDVGPTPDNVTVDRRWVPESEVRETLVWADAVVLPYIEASQSGVAPMAAALGLPLIVTPVGGLVEQVEPGATAVVAQRVDASALADAIIELASDGVRYSEMAERCLASSGVDAAWDGITADLMARLIR